MNGNSYKLLGFLVWKGGRWYVRHMYLRRLPSRRKLIASGLGALTLGGVAVGLGRRVRS